MRNIRLIIMTESSKFSGRCVAGIDVNSGDWIRLVSDDEYTHGAIAISDLYYPNGGKCDVLDIVDVTVIKDCNDYIQPENVLIDISRHIRYVGKASLKDVLDKHPVEVRSNILGNTYSYISEQRVGMLGYSLALVEVQNLEIVQVENPAGQPKTKVNFKYQGELYTQLSVTDTKFFKLLVGQNMIEQF